MIKMADKEILNVALAVAKVIKGNENVDAVQTFEGIHSKLDYYLDDVSKMTVNMMKVI